MAKRFSRRNLLKMSAALPFMGGIAHGASTAAPLQVRVRLGDPAWPSEAKWEQLDHDVGGRLIKVTSPLAACVGQTRRRLRRSLQGAQEPLLPRRRGGPDPVARVGRGLDVAAERLCRRGQVDAADVVAAVNFARTNNLRLVVKGGGHSYLGTSNAADSLLIWTRRMNAIVVHDAFVGAGCAGKAEPQPAVSIEPGAIWGQAYDAGDDQRPAAMCKAAAA